MIVTWNSNGDIDRCLYSVLAGVGSIRSEIIVVDNASDDGTCEVVASMFPTVTLIALKNNVGFPGANNIGIRASCGGCVLLLNPDTEVTRDAIHAPLERLRADPSLGLVGCRIVYGDGTIQFECAYNLPELRDPLIETCYLHMLFPKSRVFGRHRMSYWDHLQDRPVPCISGAFMMIRRTVIDQIGLLDERFFMYYEDVEYCARARRAGWGIYYLSGPTITHYAGRSRAQSVIEFDYLVPILRYTYFREYRGVGAAFLFRALSVIQGLVRAVLAVGGVLFLSWHPDLSKRPALRPALHWRRALWAVGLRSFNEVANPAPVVARQRRTSE